LAQSCVICTRSSLFGSDLRDPRAPHYNVVVIEDCGLAGCNGALRLI
jgi:hypothetical protein